MAEQKPSIGRLVHFQPTTEGAKAPAIITAVHSDTCVNLRVFSDDDHPIERVTSVVQGTGARSWSWPERV
jgi:hypothetical protein